MKLTGFSDEAGAPIEAQIKAHKALGWDTIESRFIQFGENESGSFHEILDSDFGIAADQLIQSKIGVAGVGSTIGNSRHRQLRRN